MNNSIIDNVLNNTALPEQAKTVAEWFATPEGIEYLRVRISEEKDKIDFSNVDVQVIERVHQKIKARIHRRRYRRILWGAAIIIPLFIATSSVIFLLSRTGVMSSAEYVELVVENGKRMQVILQDGSTVNLNSGTTFRYPTKFGLFKRKVYLQGQAYFDVEARASYPFIIDLNGVSLNVTGTSFDVEAYSDQCYVIVSLDEGEVNLESRDKSYSLRPKQQLIYDRLNSSAKIIDVEKPKFSSWIDTVIDVEKAPLAQVLEKLSRWYGVEFDVKTDEVYKYSYTLYFEYENVPIDTLLHKIEILSPVRFKRVGDTIEVGIE